MKIKTFILTFLMMSCSIVFGQGTETVNAKSEGDLWMYLAFDEVGTIVIANEISLSEALEIPNGKKVTIDLNGKKLSTNNDYIIKNFGKLTITDSDPEGKGTIIAPLGIYNGKPQTRTTFREVDYNVQLTINGGVFNSTSLEGGAAIYNHLGVINIKGGEFYGEYSAITNYGKAIIENAYIECLNRDNDAAAIINDFEIEFKENVNIVGIYTTVTDTGVLIGEYRPTYLFAELNGTKYPSLQAALDACTTGDNTINLLFHNSDNATVSQKEGVNITIDGNGYKGKQFEYTGTICVHGNSRHTGTETLTIQDINFTTENDSHDFILCDFRKCNEAAQEVVRYAHNVTVQNCNFNAKETSTAVVALRFRQSYNINVVGGTFTNLHSVMWATGTSNATVDGITATNCKEGGISFGASTPVYVKNSTIAGAQYGVRADGDGAYSLTVENSKLTAEVPVIVRNTTGEYNLTVENNSTLTAADGKPQVVVTAGKDNEAYVTPTSDVNVTLYDNVTSTFGLTAKIGNAFYATLQDAVDNAKTGETVTLIADNCKEDVTVNQAPNYAITIDGAEKTFKGTITVDGKSARYETTALTIKNVNFDATEGISADACINLGVSGNDNTRYTNNVTVENCTFTDNDYTSVAVKSYTGGDRNLVVRDCEANGMHSLAQLKNIEQGLVISGNIANTKNGINLNQTAVGTIEGNEINVKGYAVRIGESTGGNITLNENTLKTDNTEGDPVIELRGTVVALNMEKNVVSGNTHIKGTAGTISVDANYWDGKETPVVAEGSAPIVVNSYYSDATLSTLVRNEMGSIYAFVSSDRIFGDVTTNAKESIKIEIIGKDGNPIGSSTLEKTEHATGFNKQLTWRINLGDDDSDSWAMAWNPGAPSINNMPAKVKLYVDAKEGDAAVAEAEIKYTANGDGQSPVFAAKTNAEGKINSFIACTGEFNLNNAANKLVSASADGDNIAILTAGTYAVPTGKDLTITGAVNDVQFGPIGTPRMDGNYTFNNVTFNYAADSHYKGLQYAGYMVYNNCTFNGQVFLYGESETFNGCTFNQENSAYYNVWTYSAKEVAFNECTFNSAGKSVLIYHEGATTFNDVAVTKCEFNASQTVEDKAAIEMDSSLTRGIKLTIDGETTATGFDEGNASGNTLWNNKKGNNDDANNDITVVVDDETVLEPVYVAKIGEEGHRTLQEAINEVENGETITLLANCDEAVHINKTNVAFTIDGQISETEKVDFSGVIGINIGQNVTIRNIDFNGATANHDFIKNEGSPTGKNYNTTLLVENCSFTGNSEFDVVGVRTTHPTHTQIVNCTADGLHSLLQNTGGQKVTADNVVVINGKEGGLALGGVRAADVKNSKITANGYGVRIDAGTADAVFNIESSEFNAYIPVIARKATAQNVNFTFSGENTMTQTNEDNVWFVIENVNSRYHNGNVSLETLVTPTGNVSVTLNGTGLDRKGIYGSALNGEGTEDNPYLIETVNDLVFFREKVNGGNNYAGKHVKLAANIDLNNKEWTPIGNVTYDSKYKPADASKVFSGVFNGNGKVISNLKVASTVGGADTQANVGFFGITGEGADIKDLTLTNVNIETDGRNVGALAGFAYKATLSNITVNGNIQIKGGNNVAGVAGMTRYYDMSATNISVSGANGSAIVGNNIVGGIFAEIAPDDSEQTFNGLNVENVAITGVGGVGGIVGLLTTGTVENVSVKNVALTGRTDYQGNAMGRIRLGSVAGLMGGKYATIANEVIDNVTAKNLVGNDVVLPIIGANYDASSNATEAKIGDTYYATLETAINAVKEGDNTIQLLADVNENVTVIQKEGFNILIDGKKAENENYQFDGIINIYGNARHTGTETLTIQNIDFYTEVPNTTPYYFINALENGSVTVGNTTYNKQYAHNVTVKGCKFTTSEEDTDNQIVGIGLRQTYNIVVDNCTANHIFSLMWGTAVDGLELNEVTLENATEGITLGGASKGVEIKNSKIVSPSYGIRAEGPGHDFTITDSKIEAVVPFVVRNVAEDNNTLSFNFEGTNTIKENNPTDYWFVAGKTEYKGQTEELPTAPAGTVVVTLNDTNLSYDGVYGNFAVAKIGSVQYTSFEAALNAVEDGETIELFNITGSENKEIEFTKDIEFTITGTAPKYALPVVTFQNATVNISNAEILIPELDARQNATINVINSTVYDAGGNSIAKSYYNGAINISGTSEVYMMQVTTMGYINISGTAKLHATWQTNVYGNGLVTIKDNAIFNTAALHLTGQAYSGRDNTDTERVGKPAEIVVNGANFTVGKVYSASGADYSYNADGYGINVGTIEGKSAILTIKNGGNVNIYTGDGKTANIGADGTVNIEASTFNVECRAENGTATLANNGTMNVTGEASINIKNLTDNAINFTDVTIADAYIGGGVNAFGTNNFTGETNVTGTFSVGYNNVSAAPVVVNVTGNFNGGNVLIGSRNEHVLNLGNAEGGRTTAHFATQLGAFGDVNINNADVTYQYAFIRNDFNVTNSTMAITNANTYFSGNAKVVVDNSSWDLRGYANIGSYGGPDYKGNADVTLKNGSSMTATNLGVEQYDGKTVILTLEDSSTLTATNLSNTGSIVLANVQAKVTSNEFDNVPTTSVAYHKVNYVEGSYVVVAKDYVAQIYDVNNNTNDDRRYESLAEAATAAQDGETIQLLWNEGDAAISMAATFVGNKTVTITGTADVDWDKDWLYVGRNGEGDGKVIFDNAKLTSVSNNSAYGFNVSGGKLNDNTTNNGIVEIKNSTIVLDYMLNKNVITLDNSTLTVKNGFSVTGREASESATGEDATATMTLSNNSKVVVNNMNSMGIGHEAYGIMNIDATSTFETTQYFNISAKGTMNVNGGNVKVAGTLDNNGTMNVAAESNVEVTGNLNVNGTLKSAGDITANIVKAETATIQLTGGIYTTEPQDSWCAESYGVFPYDENSWVVREISGEQTFELIAGWNWVSSYITEFDGEDGLTMLQDSLYTNGIQIKNDNYTSNYRNNGWSGRLTSVSVKEMYKVNMSGEANFKFKGSFVNYDECEIVLRPGWNYIGYPVNVETNLADALVILSADGEPIEDNTNDILKSQQGTAINIGSGWFIDNAFNLVPGKGYMYYNSSDEVKVLRYTTKKATTTSETNTRSSKHWTADATQYPSNMTMIAMTDVEGGNYEVAAFVNGEVRGSSRPVYVESLDAYILILTISGDDVEEMTFKCYDLTTGEEVEFSNRINYSNDAVVGSANEPYMLTRGTTGIGEAAISNVTIYPNPTTTGTEINLEATCDKVEVFNALGVKVVEYQNVDTIDALETAGIYVIRITNNGNVQNCRLVVK
ncbi:MAG: T9SS type A sorting domain-containing protein [Bacteroidales bacterium]|nr:T9SS type A sorting domain-containing protein [Bacteroidales bacterium]